MNKLDKMMNGIKEDNNVPAEVWSKYTETLHDLPEQTVLLKGHRTWIKSAVAAAAALTLATTFCYANPTLAAKLPLVGRIFDEVENKATFSGDYSEKADKLITVDAENTAEVWTILCGSCTFDSWYKKFS
jgi:hypothetical protein